MRIFIISLSLYFISLFSLCGQVVNIEKKRKGLNDGLQGDIDLSISFTKNVSNILQAKNSIKLQYYRGQSLILFLNDISMVKVGGTDYLNEGFQHLRYNYSFNNFNWLTAETFIQYQYNSIRKIQRRFLAGLGPRLSLVDTSRIRLHTGPLIMYENELISGEDSPSQKIRMSVYLAFTFDLSEQLSFSIITYYQPHIIAFNNYRIAMESYLKVKLYQKLSLKIILESSYDSRPPESIPSMMYSLNTGLNYAF